MAIDILCYPFGNGHVAYVSLNVKINRVSGNYT